MKKLNVTNQITCFDAHHKFNICCERRNCKQWINNTEDNNCILVAVQKGTYTLQKIGQIYGLTRMRICQIEKSIYDKIKKFSL